MCRVQNESKKQKCHVVVLAGQDFNLIDMSIDELARLLMIELIGSNTVGLVCVMCMPASALAPQSLRCVLCALVWHAAMRRICSPGRAQIPP